MKGWEGKIIEEKKRLKKIMERMGKEETGRERMGWEDGKE